MRPHILPYYFPTTVVLIDDNQRFLENFSLQLDESLAVRCFTSATIALEHINAEATKVHLDQRCLSQAGINNQAEQSVVRLDLTMLENEISNRDRFSDIAVVIVDYDMPEMSGLELCEKIRSPRIKKILLTGVADEKIAVQAFNDGVIDRFLMKNDQDINRKIHHAISQCQRKYFSEISAVIENMLRLKAPDFIYADAFIDYFFSLQLHYSFVEYYYVEDPRGFLLVSDDGTLRRLLVFSHRELEQALFRLKRLGAPEAIIRAVASGKSLPWLWSTPDEMAPDEHFDWRDYLYPATKVGGDSDWHCAVIEDPPVDIAYDASDASYSSYLEHLDQPK